MVEDVRTRRIKTWIIWIIIAFSFIGIEKLFTNVILKEKEPFYVYAPSDMESSFERVLEVSDMSSNYEIVMTDEKEVADVIVENNKANNDEYQKIAYSPYVVAYGYNYDEAINESELMQKTNMKDVYYMNLSNLIDAVITGKEWRDFGIDVDGKIKVVYPDANTKYGESFYNLMLIAANGGKYPSDSDEYAKASVKIINFFSSDNTCAVLNMSEKVAISGGFGTDTFYIGTEKEFLDMGRYISIFSLTETISFDYYIKIDDFSKKLLKNRSKYTGWDNSSFSSILNSKYYRSEDYATINKVISNAKVFSNMHNIVRIPKEANVQIEKDG